MRIRYYTATSPDGFIATEDDAVGSGRYSVNGKATSHAASSSPIASQFAM